MTYDELLIEADNAGLVIKEKLLRASDGRIKGQRIAIRKNIPTATGKACVLAEELGHYCTSTGDILDQSIISNRKQEYRARLYGYNLQIGLTGIVKAYKYGCRNIYEMADYLDVTEEYLLEALVCYREKYGTYVSIDNYMICFIPVLAVFKKMIGNEVGGI